MSIDETLDQQITGEQRAGADRSAGATPHEPHESGGKDPNDDGVAAAARYDSRVLDFVARGRVEPAAASARVAVNGPDAPSLRAAEKAGKAPLHVTIADRMLGLYRRLRHRVSRAVARRRVKKSVDRF